MSWYSIVRRGGTTATPWTPSAATSLFGWWDADAITGLSDGSSVTAWNDSSGNGYTLSGSGPTYETNELNGKPVVRFTQDALFSAQNLAWSASGVTFAIVANRDESVAVNAHYFGSGGGFFLGTTSTRGAWADVYQSDGTRWRAQGIGGTSFLGASYFVLMMRADVSTGQLQVRHNGSSVYTNNSLSVTTGVMPSTVQFGTTFGGSNSAGDHAEMVLLNARTSDAETEKLEGYLAHKWGLTANLPGAHPHKTVAPTV